MTFAGVQKQFNGAINSIYGLFGGATSESARSESAREDVEMSDANEKVSAVARAIDRSSKAESSTKGNKKRKIDDVTSSGSDEPNEPMHKRPRAAREASAASSSSSSSSSLAVIPAQVNMNWLNRKITFPCEQALADHLKVVPFLSPALVAIIFDYVIDNRADRLLLTAKKAALRGDFMHTDMLTTSLGIKGRPTSVREFIEQHVNNPEFRNDPEGYTKALVKKMSSYYDSGRNYHEYRTYATKEGYGVPGLAFIENFLVSGEKILESKPKE